MLVRFDSDDRPRGRGDYVWRKFVVSVAQLDYGAPGVDEFGIEEVGVREGPDARHSERLRSNFGVRGADLPALRLFKGKPGGDPVAFAGEVTEFTLGRFVRRHGGPYVGLPGCLEHFDNLAAKLVAALAAGPERAQPAPLLKEAEASTLEARDEDQDSAKYYVSMMKRIRDEGMGVLAAERARQEALRASDDDGPDGLLSVERLNILLSFSSDEEPAEVLP